MKDLVDYFDDLPNLMSNLNRDQTSKFQVIEPNSSHNTDYILHEDVKYDENRNYKRIEQMTDRTLRNINGLYNSSNIEQRQPKDVQQASSIVIDKFSKLQENGVDLMKLYHQYDVNRTGNISYKDFSDTLTAVSSGLDYAEAQLLASQLDSRKSGSVNYRNILSSLQQIASSSPPSSPMKSHSPSVLVNPATQKDNVTHQSVDNAMPNFRFSVVNDDSSTSSNDRFNQPSPLSVAPRTTFEYLNESNVTRQKDMYSNRAIVSVQSLSPYNDHETSANRFNVDEDRDLPKAGRRFYHNTAAHMFAGQVPYYIEPSVEQYRQQRKRSSSAPSRARAEGRRQYPSSPNSLHATLIDTVIDKPAQDKTESVSGEVTNKYAQSVIAMLQAEKAAAIKAEQMRILAKQQSQRTVENSVVDQLGGRLNLLRHALKQQDLSKSGTVNRGEFEQGLLRSGVHLSPRQVSEMYGRLAKESASSVEMGYTGNKALNIESFVDRMQMRTVAPAFQHVTSAPAVSSNVRDDCSVSSHNSTRSSRGRGTVSHPSIAEKAARAEELRVVKKVLHNLNKASDPHQVFKQINSRNVGWINEAQLKDSLSHLNTNLSDKEFKLLMNKIDKTSDGKINLTDFEHVLHNTVTVHDDEHMRLRQQSLREYKHYNQTYQTSETVCAYETPEYDRLADSTSYKKENMRWNKLQATFQTNQRQVLAAFLPTSQETTRQSLITDHLRSNATTKHWKATAANVEVESLQQLSVPELQKSLQKVGIPLGGDDINRLQQHLHHRSRETERRDSVSSSFHDKNAEPKVTLEDFCDLVGIQYSVNDRDVIELHNPREVQVDGGTFSSSNKSQTAQPTLSTSMFLGDDRKMFRSETGDRRRKVPQPQYAHTENPSRFWELTQSSATAVLYPSPVHSLREAWPNQKKTTLDKVSAARGIVRVNTMHTESDKVQGASHQGMEVNESKSRKRSVSAPPRSISGNVVVSDPILQIPVSSHDTSTSRPHTAKATEVIRTTASTTADQIARWGSSSLAEYFNKINSANSGKSESQQPHSGKTTAASSGTSSTFNASSDRLNITMRPLASPRTQRDGSLSLRRQYTPQHSSTKAPYAMD